MRVVNEYGRENLAKVYVAEMRNGKYLIEFVESLQPPLPRNKKWVIIVSTMFGCPVNCMMCDAGGEFHGKLTTEEILQQVDYLVSKRYPNGDIPVEKLKIQFARMGEPAFNSQVLEVLGHLPTRYHAPGLIPSVSTVAPKGREQWFNKLRRIKNKRYTNGHFQLQFSIHTTDTQLRDKLMPIKKWSFEQIARHGESFFTNGDRKITLNFAVAKDYPVDTRVVRRIFTPDKFLIKLTPLNPTRSVKQNKLLSAIDPYKPRSAKGLVAEFRAQGYETILSIGEVEENKIGSNCGLFVSLSKSCG